MASVPPDVDPVFLEELTIAAKARPVFDDLDRRLSFWEAVALTHAQPALMREQVERPGELRTALADTLDSLRKNLGPVAEKFRSLLKLLPLVPKNADHREMTIAFTLISEKGREAATKWVGNPAMYSIDAADRLRKIEPMVWSFLKAMEARGLKVGEPRGGKTKRRGSTTRRMAPASGPLPDSRPAEEKPPPRNPTIEEALFGLPPSKDPDSRDTRRPAKPTDVEKGIAETEGKKESPPPEPAPSVAVESKEPPHPEPAPSAAIEAKPPAPEIEDEGPPIPAEGLPTGVDAEVLDEIRRVEECRKIFEETHQEIEVWEVFCLVMNDPKTIKRTVRGLLRARTDGDGAKFNTGALELFDKLLEMRGKYHRFVEKLRDYLAELPVGHFGKDTTEMALGFIVASRLGRETAEQWLAEPKLHRAEATGRLESVISRTLRYQTALRSLK